MAGLEFSASLHHGDIIWVLCGGRSTEHDVSISSGTQVAATLAAGPWRARPVVIDRQGRWRLAEALSGPEAEFANMRRVVERLRRGDALSLTCEEALSAMRKERPTCVFIALHGPGGEDGAIQGMLEWCNVPYTGSRPAAGALAMDKIRSQILFRSLGFMTPPSVSSLQIPLEDRLAPEKIRDGLADLAAKSITPPWFVKPGSGGSSLGVTRVTAPSQLAEAISGAMECCREVLIEQGIAGREMTCAVLDQKNPSGAYEPVALPVTEIRPLSSDYFDYKSKYDAQATQEITPAEIDESTARQIQDLALKAHCALGCSGMSRSDFILDGDKNIYILEINTIPGMTPTSLMPQAAKVMGLSFVDLCQSIIESALAGARG